MVIVQAFLSSSSILAGATANSAALEVFSSSFTLAIAHAIRKMFKVKDTARR